MSDSDILPSGGCAFSECRHPVLLEHVSVLDLTDERGSFCSKVLGDLGATVIKVVSPAEYSEVDPSAFFNNAAKIKVPLEINSSSGVRTLGELIKRADILVENFAQDSSWVSILKQLQLSRINACLVHLSITPAGRTGTGVSDRGDVPELTGCDPDFTASLFGAVAALLRLRKSRIAGRGSYIDLSIGEAVASMLERDLIRSLQKIPAEPSTQDNFSVLRTRDGYVQIPILRNWETISDLISAESNERADAQWQNSSYREAHFSAVAAMVENWTRGHARHELFQLGQDMGMPWASVETREEVFKNPHLTSRAFYKCIEIPPEGRAASMPGSPYVFSSAVSRSSQPIAGSDWADALKRVEPRSVRRRYATRADCPDEMTLEGLRVLDLTRVISGPYATRILGDFGAEVLKIQSQKTAGGAEQNESLQFSIWNRNKRSITLDLDCSTDRDTFLKLAARSDIVIENFSPRVMANWQLEYERLHQINPALIMVSISAMGHTGPWRNYVGYAPNFHALSGLIHETSLSRNCPPVDINFPYADFLAGLYAALATLSALEFRDRTGKGQHIDLSAFEAICTLPSRTQKFSESMDSSPISAEEWGARIIGRLKARNFYVSLDHPSLGKIYAFRTPVWDWRRKPRWRASPLLGEYNKILGV